MRQAAFPSSHPQKLHARAQLSRPPCLETSRRSGFHQATVVRTNLVDCAWIATGLGDDQRRTSVSGVIDEPPAGRPVVDHCESTQNCRAIRAGEHTGLVRFEQVDGARAVMATAATGDAVCAARIGQTFDGRKWHFSLVS
jgi:hypothetical protein